MICRVLSSRTTRRRARWRATAASSTRCCRDMIQKEISLLQCWPMSNLRIHFHSISFSRDKQYNGNLTQVIFQAIRQAKPFSIELPPRARCWWATSSPTSSSGASTPSTGSPDSRPSGDSSPPPSLDVSSSSCYCHVRIYPNM